MAAGLSSSGPMTMRLDAPRLQQPLAQLVDVRDKRLSLLLALSLQVGIRTRQEAEKLVAEGAKYISPKRFSEARSLEEALMTVPDLETIPYRLVSKYDEYEIREVESYLVAETTVPGSAGFDFMGSSQAFNTIAEYIFGKNTKNEEMAMTTPVIVRKEPDRSRSKWQMAFVLPSKYEEETLPSPQSDSVELRRVPPTLLAVTSFSGFVSTAEVKKREERLRKLLAANAKVRVKPNATVQVSQYNPPFTPPMFRRNEVALEVESTE